MKAPSLPRILALALLLATLAHHGMAANTGTLIISSYPLGADVYLDEKYIGKTTRNIILQEIGLGLHYVEWRMESYKTCWKFVDVMQGETAAAHCEMDPHVGDIDVKSDPPGASVIVDSAQKGRSPMIVRQVPVGLRTVTLRYPGYYDCTVPVTVEEMVTVPVNCTLEEIPTTGTIIANATPVGAEVYLDEKAMGTSTMTIRKIEPGRHTLSFSKYGYHDWSTSIDVVAAKIYDINPVLDLKNGTISLTSKPPAVDIVFRGLVIGKTPYRSEFFQGTHDFLFSAPAGYRDQTVTISVPFEGTSREVTLECAAPDAIARAEKDISDNALFNPSYARERLEEARDLQGADRCVDAFQAATNASSWARDVDNDGVPNFQDIWKSIPNIFIYFSPFILGLIGIVGVVSHRAVNQLGPRIDIEEIPPGDDQGRRVRVTTQLSKEAEFFYCAVWLDGTVIDQLDAPGTREIPLGSLDPGTHTVQVELDAYRNRIWRNHIEKSCELTVTS